MILRPYQREASDAIQREWRELVSTLLVLPTGTGKTVVFADVIRRSFPRRSMVIAHRQELIWQAREKIQAATGLKTEVEMGEYKAQGSGGLFNGAHVVVSTIQTLTAGGDGLGRIGKFDPQQYDRLIVDEAHHATSPSYQRTIDYFRQNPRIKILGVTATPDRADEEALGQVFESVAFDYEILDAIKDGWLVPIEQQFVNVDSLDLTSVRTTAGDLNGADLDAILTSEKNLHGVAWPTIEIIGDRRTLVFTSSVNHAQRLSEIFNRHRPGCAVWVCGKTDKDERRKINSDFNSGRIQILCNCGTHTEGFDSPGVEVVCMARPTKSRSLYAQMVGRSTRPLPGVVDGPESVASRRQAIASSAKPSCLVIDFVGNVGRHKLVTTADILGGKVSERALENALKRAASAGKPVRMDQTLQEEEERLLRAEERRLAEEASRARLVAKSKFSTQSVDPFDVLQIKPIAERGWDKGKLLSDKQKAFLRKRGINPDALSYPAARQLISEMMFRFENKLATFNQSKILKRHGLDTNVSFEDASKMIDQIVKGGRRPARDLGARCGEDEGETVTAVPDDNCPF
jgi:superfamily II DNA or RNA helicase